MNLICHNIALKSKIYRRKVIPIFLLSGILFLSVLIPPFYEGRFTVCLFKNVFGIPCPGCGMTRAFLFLGHGDIHNAIRLNLNSLLVFFIVIFLWFTSIVKIFTGKEVKIQLTQQERSLIYFVSANLMAVGWVYNLFLNPYL